MALGGEVVSEFWQGQRNYGIQGARRSHFEPTSPKSPHCP